MSRIRTDPRISTRARLGAGLTVMMGVLTVSAHTVTAGGDPFALCGFVVENLDDLNDAIADFVDPDSSCTVIDIGQDFDVEAEATTDLLDSMVSPIALIATGEIDSLEPIDRSLTIDGNGHVITGIDSPPGLFVMLDGVGAPYTLTVRNLGLRNFGGWGALAVASGNTQIVTSRFAGNDWTSQSPADQLSNATGGAINTVGSLQIFDSEFIGNSGSNGGAIYTEWPYVTEISGTTFADNTASSTGGAIYSEGTLSLLNSTFSGNSAVTSGGVVAGLKVYLEFCTFIDNSSESSGAAVSAVGDVSVLASIVYGNRIRPDSAPAEYADVVSTEGEVVIDYSLLTNDVSSSSLASTLDIDDTNIFETDPKLNTLGDYGGFILPGGTRISTRPPRSRSRVVDQFSLVEIYDGDGPYDQRGIGFPRMYGGLADMGAVEFRPSPRVVLTPPEPVTVLPNTR